MKYFRGGETSMKIIRMNLFWHSEMASVLLLWNNIALDGVTDCQFTWNGREACGVQSDISNGKSFLQLALKPSYQASWQFFHNLDFPFDIQHQHVPET